jgi:hypothetical protein
MFAFEGGSDGLDGLGDFGWRARQFSFTWQEDRGGTDSVSDGDIRRNSQCGPNWPYQDEYEWEAEFHCERMLDV